MFLIETAEEDGGIFFVNATQYIVGSTNVNFYKPGTIDGSYARLIRSIPVADIITINGESIPE